MFGFTKQEIKYQVIELDKSTKLPELTADLKESLKTLQFQPAFQYILQRQRIKKAAMQNALNEGYKLKEEELRYLQAGIFWAGDIERDIKLLTQDQVTSSRPATEDEAAQFRRIANSISLVGQD